MAGLAWTLGEASPPPAARARFARARRLLAGAGRGLAFGTAANVLALRFVPGVVASFTPLPYLAGVLALLLLAMFEAARWVVAALVCQALARGKVPRAWAFAMGVYAGTFVPTVFPWTAAGGVSPWPAMVQLADVVGERGVTVIMAAAAGLVGEAARAWLARDRRTAARALAIATILPVATLVIGCWRISRVEAWRASAPTVHVGLVEPSTAATERWEESRAPGILARLVALTRTTEARGAELTVWPEAAYPYPVAHASRRAPVGARAILPAGVRGPVLTGLITQDGPGVTYNSAAVVTRDGTLSEPYDKIRLLWFGETVPLADRFPWLRRTFARGIGLAAGGRNVVEAAGPVRASVLNCFEDTLPAAGRDAMDGSPNLLVNVTNDAWFAGSPESELHLRLAAMRAVELRRDLVRAVNFGPTSWVDAAGRVRARYDGPVAGAIVVEPALLDATPTLYARAGDWPWIVAFGLASLLAARSNPTKA